ncbi:MAG: ABC transporter permease subunit [Anaerolineales bacterium]
MNSIPPPNSNDKGNEALRAAHEALALSDKAEVRRLARYALKLLPNSERPWLYLAATSEPKAGLAYLAHALERNPNSKPTKKAIKWMLEQLPVDEREKALYAANLRSMQPLPQSKVQGQRLARARIRLALSIGRLKGAWGEYKRSSLGVIGLVLILLFAVMAAIHPILMDTVWPSGIYDPQVGFDSKVFHPSTPSSAHLLGTDALGRDVLSRLLAATTPTFALGLAAALAASIIGTIVGAYSGYYRGSVDSVLSRLSDVALLLPAPILMVIIGTRFRDIGPLALGLIYGFVAGAGGTAIILRSQSHKLRESPFVEASRSSGAGSTHVLTRHVIPHLLPLAALSAMVVVTGAVVADGFISFFGFTRSIHNWGTMIYETFTYDQALSIPEPSWHSLIPPALALSLFALAFYLTSRGMERVADPQRR